MHTQFQKIERDIVRNRLTNLIAYALRFGITKEELHQLIDSQKGVEDGRTL
jgi:DNA-binding transcriptional regulator YhcF (GntR family)